VRRGKQYRINSDRFFHIMNEGWFVYMRQEQKKAESNNGVAGPFETKMLATHHLERAVHLAEFSGDNEPQNQQDSSGEDWRY